MNGPIRALSVLLLLGGIGARAEAQTSTEAPQKPSRLLTFELSEHPRLRLGRALTLNLEGKFDVGSGVASDELGSDSQLDLGRRRVGVSGALFHILEFQIEREIGDDDPWRDVFVAAHMTKGLAVKGGKFKAPYSRAQLTSLRKLDFVHRPLAATALSPGRQVGFAAEGRLHEKVFGYELGLFSETVGTKSPQTTGETAGDKLMIAGRLTASPFRKRKQVLETIEIGVGATIGERAEGLASVAGRTFSDRRRFFPEMYVNGQRRRTGYELSWVRGALSLTAEYLRVSDERKQQGIAGQDLPDLVADGWYVSTAWLVAGERRPTRLPRGVTPFTKGGLELAFRAEELRFGSEANGEPAFRNPRAAHVLGNANRAMTLGINWYASRFARVQCNAIRERVADAERSPNNSSRPFWSIITRLQLHL
jgi:phosphate-selective porin